MHVQVDQVWNDQLHDQQPVRERHGPGADQCAGDRDLPDPDPDHSGDTGDVSFASTGGSSNVGASDVRALISGYSGSNDLKVAASASIWSLA